MLHFDVLAQACNQCHHLLFDDGAGSINSNVHRDPLHSGVPSLFIQRNTPHVFATGALQRLAEEMTTTLHQQRDAAVTNVCNTELSSETVRLSAKGVDFGRLTISQIGGNSCTVAYDTSQLAGVDADLIVKPFYWKGKNASLRAFNREAILAHGGEAAAA